MDIHAINFLLKTKKTRVTQKAIVVRQQDVCVTMLRIHLAYSHTCTHNYIILLFNSKIRN